MKLKTLVMFGGIGLAVGALALSQVGAQSSTLRVFAGSTFRPDLLQPIFDRFEKKTGTKVVLELGGATSELQGAYLSTVLGAKDPSLDVMLIDVIRPAQFQAQGWLEPLDKYFGGDTDRQEFIEGYVPGPIKATTFNNELWALPATTDVQFLYYRKDLLEKYKVAVPKTWEELTAAAQKITAGEGNPNLQGLNFQGAPIEGAVCMFLQPFWAAGGDFMQGGKVNVNNEFGRKALNLWVDSINKSKISPALMAEVRTDDSRRMLQQGNVVFGLNWAYAWAHFQGNGGPTSGPTAVKGNIGVARLPAFAGSKVGSSTCQGGASWGISSFGKNKQKAFDLIRYMSDTKAQEEFSIKGGFLPVRKALYNNSNVLKANPHYDDLYPVILKARPRPVTANYPKVSEIIRTNVNAVVAGSKTVDKALTDMQSALEPLIK
jgi:multiple sugar transport system substrate-binding protein